MLSLEQSTPHYNVNLVISYEIGYLLKFFEFVFMQCMTDYYNWIKIFIIQTKKVRLTFRD